MGVPPIVSRIPTFDIAEDWLSRRALLLRLEDGDFVPVDGGLLGRAHLFGHSRSKFVRTFLARAQCLLVFSKRDRKRLPALPVDQQDPTLTALLVCERHDLLAEVGDACINLAGRATQGSNTCVHLIPPLGATAGRL